MKRLILASGSNRRRALLEALGIEIEVLKTNAPEVDHGTVPAAIVEANARAKRDAAAQQVQGGAVIVAADTLVFLDEQVLSKPADTGEAQRMLRRLSGNTHQVLTGLAVIDTSTGEQAEGAETTDVTFRILSDAEIDTFVRIVNPVDRAGGYTADGPGSLLVSRFDGCYQNVLGLPVVRLDKLLRTVGVNLFEQMTPERARFL